MRPPSPGGALPFDTLIKTVLEPLSRIKDPSTNNDKSSSKRKRGESSEEKRADCVDELIRVVRSEHGGDIYSAIRLVAPELDVDTGPTGVKTRVMAKILPRALLFHGKKSEDRIRLDTWSAGLKDDSGNPILFTDICRDVIEKRPISAPKQKIDVNEVCSLVDRLAAETKEDGRVNVLREMYHGMSTTEFTWAVRIILGDIQLGINDIFMGLWHEKAREMMRVRSCLREVCWKLADPGAGVSDADLGLELFRCYQPQVATRQVKDTDGTLSDLLNKTLKSVGVKDGEEFYVEEKLDGERMQLHVHWRDDDDMGFRWWSRDGFDWTHVYGGNLSEGTLARHLGKAFFEKGQGRVVSIILDGEMVVWHSESGTIIPHSVHKPSISHGRTTWPLYRIFDIVMLNGRDITRQPLENRRRTLALAVPGVQNRLEVHAAASATTAEELERSFREVMLDGREGLVVKYPHSTYNPGLRLRTWMKLKPEYSPDCGQALVCVIIGRSYGRGANAGKLTRYLCGVREGGDSGMWLSFCRVGNGFSAADHREIALRTEGKWREWGDGKAAARFIRIDSFGHGRPDQWIEPDRSVVISVRAAAVNASPYFATGTSLLHPRLEEIPPLDPGQALSKPDLDALESVRSVAKSAEDSARPPAAKGRPGRGATALTVENHSAEALATTAVSTLFQGKSFFIGAACDDPKLSKDEMVVLVKRNGGVILVDFMAADFAISHRMTLYMHSRARKDKDVIHPRWLAECNSKQQLVALREEHYRHSCAATMAALARE